MANQGPFKVEYVDWFPHGTYLLGMGPMRDFERSTADREVQARDKETGHPIWVVEGLNADPHAREKTFKVKIPAPHQPVPPEATPGVPFRPVEFEGLTVTAYVDDKRCTGPRKGESHRCRAQVAYSLRATGLRAPGSKSATQTSGGKAA